MPNLNKVMLMGNLTRDPELRYTQNNTAVAQIGLAINRKWKDQAGEQREEVTFIDCDAWGKTAEILNQYVRKGNPIYIEGRLKLDQWTDKEGGKRSKLKVVVESMQFLQSKDQGGQSQQQPPEQQRQPAKQPAPLTGDGAFQPVDEDNIPFTHDAWQF